MTEIKQTWLTCYGLSDHDFPIKWIFRLRRSRGNKGFSGWFPISPSSALRAPSPSREKVLLRFWEQWILQLRVNPACRMTWGWGESGRRNRIIKVCRYKRHDKNRFCTEAQHMNQSKIKASGFYGSGIMTCFKELKRFWKWSGSISEVPLSPPSSALRAPSPSREKVFLRFLETVDSATPGKPFVQNDMRVGWEWKKKPVHKNMPL